MRRKHLWPALAKIVDAQRVSHFWHRYDFLAFMSYVGLLVLCGKMALFMEARYPPHMMMEQIMPLRWWGATGWVLFALMWAANQRWIPGFQLQHICAICAVYWLTIGGCFIVGGSETGWIVYCGLGIWCMIGVWKSRRIETIYDELERLRRELDKWRYQKDG